MGRKRLCSLLIFMVLCYCSLWANQDQHQLLDQRIEQLRKLEGSELKDSVISIFKYVYEVSDRELGHETAEKVLEITRYKKGEAQIHSLVYMGIYADTGRIKYLDEAQYLAEEAHDLVNLAWIQDSKSTIYRQTGKYDLAMLSILESKELYQKLGMSEKMASVLHTIGDLHFEARLYDIAQKYYEEAIEIVGDPEAFNNWRHFVLLNNMGLIKMEQARYDEAISLFSESLKQKIDRPADKIDSVAASYVYGLFCEIYTEKHDYQRALQYYGKGYKVLEQTNKYAFLANFSYLHCRINFETGNYESAMADGLKSLEHLEKVPDYSNLKLKLYKQLSLIYNNSGDHAKAYFYLEQYQQLSDSISQEANKIKSLLILADSEYDLIQYRYETEKRNYFFVLAGLILTVIVLSIILFLYIKIRRANLKLVEKAMENSRIEKEKPLFTQTDKFDHQSNSDTYTENLELICEHLDFVISNDRLFLEKDFSIQAAADRISSNRSYVSKAINTCHKKNFVSYLNAFRIQFAIDLIKGGEMAKTTIESIADRAGFKNRSVFYSAFKNYTGVSPTFFIRNFKSKTEPEDLD